jgi:DNA (cytosine-5)-methyltransferase 1
MKLLDLYCGAGGAAMGYFRAGFTEILGVDIRPQPNYPFEFFKGDAIEFLSGNIDRFDLIHASPTGNGGGMLH